MTQILRRVAIASAIALAAVLLWFRRVDPGKAVSRIPTVPVVVAATDIPEGFTLDRVGLAVAQWPAGTQPAGAYTSVDSVAGRVSRVPIYKGEAMVPGRLAPGGTAQALEVKITPGKRAYGIRINDVASLAGMVQPNSRVDIMVVTYDPEASKQVARLFMSNVRVLAISAAPARDEDGRPINAAIATIEVTPEQTEKLALVAAQGALQLVLRGYGDPDTITTSGPITRDLLLRRPRAIAPGRPDSVTVRVYRDTLMHDLLRRSPRENRFQLDSSRPAVLP